jgi:hypothetical protein
MSSRHSYGHVNFTFGSILENEVYTRDLQRMRILHVAIGFCMARLAGIIHSIIDYIIYDSIITNCP